MKKILTLLTLLFLANAIFAQNNKKVTNSKSFIHYLSTADAIKDYTKFKKQVQKEGLEIRDSKTLSNKDKARLKGLYDIAYQQSDSLFDKILDSLLNENARKAIVSNPDIFAKFLQKDLNKIVGSAQDFSNAYARTKDLAAKSPILEIIIKEVIIPFAIEFIKETIVPMVIKQYANKKLKPIVVITPWNDL